MAVVLSLRLTICSRSTRARSPGRHSRARVCRRAQLLESSLLRAMWCVVCLLVAAVLVCSSLAAQLVTFGGFTSTQSVSSSYSYFGQCDSPTLLYSPSSPSSRAWAVWSSHTSSVPAPRCFASMTAVNDKAYLIGGHNSLSEPALGDLCMRLRSIAEFAVADVVGWFRDVRHNRERLVSDSGFWLHTTSHFMDPVCFIAKFTGLCRCLRVSVIMCCRRSI